MDTAAFSAAFARDFGAALARRQRGPSRQSCLTHSRRKAAIPAYLADFRLTKGRCLRKRCASRYAVTRLTIDLRSRERIDRTATLECATCGHTWRRTRVPRIGEYQSTLLTLILPGDERRWYARGRWHREGDDAVVIRDATQLELMGAEGDWKVRNGQYLDARARVAIRKAEAERVQHEATMDLLARLAARDAERAAEEAAAIDRED